MTLTYIELEHVQSMQCMDLVVWSTGVANENAQFVALLALVKCSEAERRQFFTVSDRLITLISSFFATFVLTDRQTTDGQTTDGQNQLLSPLRMYAAR